MQERFVLSPRGSENTCSRQAPLPRGWLGAGAALLLLLALLAAGCGITFGESSDETEVFEDLRIEGDFVPSGALAFTLHYKRQYPVAIIVACDILQDGDGKRSERVLAEVFSDAIAANASGGPFGEATPEAGSFEHAFTAPGEPGRYLLECYTVQDDNNAIIEEIRIRAS